MGIAVPDTGSRRRSNLASATYTVLALVLFFGVGLAGGTVYKIYFGNDAGPQVADRVSPPPSPPATPPIPAQNFAADAPSAAAAAAAPDLARVEPSAAPALAVPPQAEATKPAATIAQAAPPAPEPAPQAAPAAPLAAAPVPFAEAAPAQPAPQPETPGAGPQRIAAIAPKKPAAPTTAAKAHRTAPVQTAALHMSSPAPGKAAVGAFRVQFGAFAVEENARRVQWAIEATGVKIEISQEPGPSGHALFLVRSPAYPDYASALSAAQTVQNRAKHLVNPIAIDYAIRADHSAAQQQAQH
jgi:hypothetical protein